MKIIINNEVHKLDRSFIYSGGEVQVRLPEFPSFYDSDIIIESKLTSSDKIIELMLVADALKYYFPNCNKVLRCYYFPYARQDRRCVPGEAHSLSVMLGLIHSLSFNEIYIADFHAELSLLEPYPKFKHISQTDIFWKHQSEVHNVDILIAPDKSAKDKVRSLSHCFDKPCLQAGKVRNLDSRSIESITVDPNIETIKNKNILIVDDICDSGSTIVNLVNNIKQYNPSSISYHITHGIFSKGLDVLFNAGISKVITTNSLDHSDPRLIIIEI